VPWFLAIAIILHHGRENQRTVCSFIIFNVHWRIQESCAVAEKAHKAILKFDMYWNLQWHHVVLPAIARLSCIFLLVLVTGSVTGLALVMTMFYVLWCWPSELECMFTVYPVTYCARVQDTGWWFTDVRSIPKVCAMWSMLYSSLPAPEALSHVHTLSQIYW